MSRGAIVVADPGTKIRMVRVLNCRCHLRACSSWRSSRRDLQGLPASAPKSRLRLIARGDLDRAERLRRILDLREEECAAACISGTFTVALTTATLPSISIAYSCLGGEEPSA